MGWSGKIRVNGMTYKWLGMDETGTATNVTNVQVTPTRTIFVMQAGPMNVTITFLSPVEPDDWVKQSIPFSYVSVEFQSLDGNSYPVQLYSDISAEWASGDRSSIVQWSNADTGSSIYHRIRCQSSPTNVEIANQAQDGTTYYAISTSQPDISWQIDLAETVREWFHMNGRLTNTTSTAFAPISPNTTVFALSADLGTIRSTTTPVTWSVGYVRDPSITYTAPNGAVQQWRPYYVSQYKNIEEALDAFTGDYAAAHDRAVALDQKIMSAAANFSSEYSDLVSLATRQAMSTLDFTVGTDSYGNLVPGDVKIFMKNLGTDSRVNPVEHIYAAFPMFLYLNASIGGALLQPLLESQAILTGQLFASADIGNAYPNATGSRALPNQGVEREYPFALDCPNFRVITDVRLVYSESGNMLIMELAYARISGDGTLISHFYNTSKRWADYLVSSALHPQNQTNLDGDITNLANIALKGIIGVKAMAEIAHALGEDSDAVSYNDQASSLFNSWLSLTTSSSGLRLLGGYGNETSWSLMYNLFADKMLGLDFVPQSVIDMQTQYLTGMLATASEFGLPVDSESEPYGNTAWSLFASAFVSDIIVRDTLIRSIHNHANSNVSQGLFAEIYNTSYNSYEHGTAGPALGGVFSHLVLTVPNQTISASGSSTGGQQSRRAKSSSNVGKIAGGVIGGLAVVGVGIAIFTILIRKRRTPKYKETDTLAEVQHRHPTLPSNYRNPSSDYISISIRSDAATAGLAGTGADNMRTCDSSAAISLFLNPSQATKARREARVRGTQQSAPSEPAATSSNVGSQTGSASSRDPPSLTGESISTTDVVGLRTEVENLRRVMRDVRAERLEPPPEYAE
ncbi:hypothetical protein V8D89_006036 [Ganoderma adspersum]